MATASEIIVPEKSQEIKDNTEATEGEKAENKENGEGTGEQDVNRPDEKEPEVIETPLPTENPLLAVLPQIAPESGEAEEQGVTDGEDKEKKEAALDFLRDETLMKVFSFSVFDSFLTLLNTFHCYLPPNLLGPS